MSTRSDDDPWVLLTHARHQPEADLIVNMLDGVGIHAFHRRTMGFDVPDFLAMGARAVLVRASDLERAREQLAPLDDDAPDGEDP